MKKLIIIEVIIDDIVLKRWLKIKMTSDWEFVIKLIIE